MDIIIGIFDSIARIFAYVWWLVLPVFIFFIFWNLRMIYIRTRYVKSLEWTLVEGKIPPDILRTPKAMEQIFASLSATYSFGFSWVDLYIDGKVDPWISFEMVG